MSGELLSKPRSFRSLRNAINPVIVLLLAIIALLLLLLFQPPPFIVERSIQVPPDSSIQQEQPQPQPPSLAEEPKPEHKRSNDHTPSLAHTRSDWQYGDVADVCKPIFEKLAHNGFLCGMHERPGSCTIPDDWRDYTARGVWMFSQFAQDVYVFVKHFTRLKRRGVYLDIASNQPIRLSNTYFFDRCLGWRGICVEANEQYYEPTFRERSCQLVPTCAGSTEGEVVQFRLRGEIGGVVGDSYKFGNSSKGNIVEKRCTTAQTVLDRTAISHVDFMSLDVEGHELQVLKGIDFERTRIDIMTIEVTPSFEEVKKLLLGFGYERHLVGDESEKSSVGKTFLGLDAIFVRKGVRFGHPE
ncbi:unnamed protein product [Agarophyton chilense]